MAKKTVTKAKVSKLELVYPPMSNQEAIWFRDEPEVELLLRQSDFYVIGGRPEIKFSEFHADEALKTLDLTVTIGGGLSDRVQLVLRDLPDIGEAKPQSFWIETGDKFVRVWDRPQDEPGADVLAWFTTEKLLYDRAHNVPGIVGLDRHAEFAVYDLLYVGIARTGDSFDRLIARGHLARTEILANEPQRYPGARVSDETYLFLFRVNSLVISTFDPDHDFQDGDFADTLNPKQVVADAEKAFVSLLKPGYNTVQFAQYPKGKDGLYGAGYARYGYAIDETLTFDSGHGRIRGVHDANGVISNSSDFILVSEDEVKLFVSGVDFPATPWRKPTDKAPG